MSYQISKRRCIYNFTSITYSMMIEEILSAIIESKKKEIDYKPIVLDVIEKLDDGKGVEIKRLFEVLNMP